MDDTLDLKRLSSIRIFEIINEKYLKNSYKQSEAECKISFNGIISILDTLKRKIQRSNYDELITSVEKLEIQVLDFKNQIIDSKLPNEKINLSKLYEYYQFLDNKIRKERIRNKIGNELNEIGDEIMFFQKNIDNALIEYSVLFSNINTILIPKLKDQEIFKNNETDNINEIIKDINSNLNIIENIKKNL